jgi:hypothetical protein
VSPSVLFTVANANQAANAVPVAGELLDRGIGCHVMVLDPVYRQGARAVIAASPIAPRIRWVDATPQELDPPFAKLSMGERWRAVHARRKDVAAAAGDHDGVLAGMDGAFERLVLKRYRDARRFNAILWDGLIKRQPRLLPASGMRDLAGLPWHVAEWCHFVGRRALLRAAVRVGGEAYVPGLGGHTPVDVIYTAGRFVTEALRSQGVVSAIETTGIPRFAGLARIDRGAETVDPRSAVYLTGAFLWHDDAALDRCQQRDLDTLAEALVERGRELRIRLHPREDAARYARFEGRPGVVLSPSQGIPLWTELARAGVVITSVSTAGLEALALGRPLLVYLGAFPRALQDITIGSHPGIPVARRVSELDAALARLDQVRPEELASVVADFVAPGTADSASRIADSIARGL